MREGGRERVQCRLTNSSIMVHLLFLHHLLDDNDEDEGALHLLRGLRNMLWKSKGRPGGQMLLSNGHSRGEGRGYAVAAATEMED